jgi:hypothetical protein
MFINTGNRWINLDNVTEITIDDSGVMMVSFNTGAWDENGQPVCYARKITDENEIDRIVFALEGQMKAI